MVNDEEASSYEELRERHPKVQYKLKICDNPASKNIPHEEEYDDDNYESIVCVCIYGTGTEFRLRKRWRGSDASIVTRILALMPADMQTNYGVSCVHVQWFSCWKIKADDCDIMK